MKYALIARKAVCDTPENHLKLGFEKTIFQLFRARTLEARNLKSDFLYPLFIDLFVNDNIDNRRCNMKRLTNSIIKVISVMMAASLCASLVTACNGQKDDRTDFTTRTTESELKPGLSEPNQTIDTMSPDQTTETAGSTTAPTGKYTYTVYAGTEYETTLSMDVNIDDYLIDNGNKTPFFSIGLLCEDTGWLINGKPNCKDPIEYLAYVYGDTQMVLQFRGKGSISDNACGYSQLDGFTYHLAPIGDYKADARTTGEIQTSQLNYGIIVTFAPHENALCYHTAANLSLAAGISREDAIIIAYVFSSAITRPGENPFIGTNLEKAYSMNSDNYLSYTLP